MPRYHGAFQDQTRDQPREKRARVSSAGGAIFTDEFPASTARAAAAPFTVTVGVGAGEIRALRLPMRDTWVDEDYVAGHEFDWWIITLVTFLALPI
jgi:hypothetical protein